MDDDRWAEGPAFERSSDGQGALFSEEAFAYAEQHGHFSVTWFDHC